MPVRTLSLLLATFIALSSVGPAARAAEPEFLDTYQTSVDNDGDAEKIEGLDPATLEPLESNNPFYPAANGKKFMTAEEVLATLSPLLEEKFDTFIIGNTSTRGASGDLVPFQHIRVLRKAHAGAKVFTRNEAGLINGINDAGLAEIEGLPKLLPVSSGAPGRQSMRTFSGVFRMSHELTKGRLNTSPEAGMSYSSYIDFVYAGGRASGIAVHGTPTRNHRLLGRSRASHGCFRTFPAYAKILRTHLMRPEMMGDDLPRFDRAAALPSEEVQTGARGTQRGLKALVIIFNGYEASGQDI